MVARVPRLRRGPRPRSADDDDWGTASIPYDMPSPVDVPVGVDSEPGPPTRVPIVDRLKQQELESYTLTFSPRVVITFYFFVAILFMPLGCAIVAGTSKISGVPKTKYSNGTDCIPSKNEEGMLSEKDCLVYVDFNVSERILPPSYFYYSLSNYYQNHRAYVKSRSAVMHLGILPVAPIDVETCDPWLYKEGTTNGSEGFNTTEFRYPCGLTARSFFNDTFEICVKRSDRTCKKKVNSTGKGITIWTDREHKFQEGNDPLYNELESLGEGFPSANELLRNEHFIAWMRLSAFSEFDKLYHIIEEPLLPELEYTVHIKNFYPVNAFAGSKFFKITTVSWFGAENVFLGTAYLVVGLIALVIASTLLIKHMRNPRLPAGTDPDILLRELAKLNIEYRKPRMES